MISTLVCLHVTLVQLAEREHSITLPKVVVLPLYKTTKRNNVGGRHVCGIKLQTGFQSAVNHTPRHSLLCLFARAPAHHIAMDRSHCETV